MTRAARAAALVAAATLAGCCTCSRPSTFTYRAGSARAPVPAPPLEAPSRRYLHLADFGAETCQQARIAAAVEEAHRRAPFDAAFFPGDLIYPCGPDVTAPGAAACRFAADDNTVEPGLPPDTAAPSFRVHEEPLAPLARPPAAQVYVTLGNHDVGSRGGCAGPGDPEEIARLRACLNVAHASPLWSMPGRHYAVDRGPARFLAIDSNLLRGDYGGFSFEDEVAFVREAAPACRADACEAEPGGCEKPYCFLVAHHPAVSAGSHADEGDAEYLARVARLVEAGGGRLRAWLAGHDHDLQHLRSAAGLDVFVSGTGQSDRPNEQYLEASGVGTQVLFGSVAWGIGVLEVGPSGWRYRFEGVDGAPFYCCAATGTGRCEPVRCE